VAGSHSAIYEAYYHQVSSHNCLLSVRIKDDSLSCNIAVHKNKHFPII